MHALLQNQCVSIALLHFKSMATINITKTETVNMASGVNFIQLETAGNLNSKVFNLST